jgi:peptidoglycan/xylan/chitin deacetylase (PgdA/CDA1 family)
MAAGMAVGMAMLAACGSDASEKPVRAEAVAGKQVRKPDPAAAARVKANELGKIPVLMYHRVEAKPPTPEDRTPRQFRAELERLAAEGYVPVTAAEYVTGKIGVPAGRHPVVLTFDDSSPSQLRLDGAGTPAPDSAVGILLDVARRHPGFRPVATFYVTRDVFGATGPDQQAQYLAWLRERGFDIGNHTKDHDNLRGMPKAQAQEKISAGHGLITSLGSPAPVTLALPYGNQPARKEWALRGSGAGGAYRHLGVFLAGYEPAPSPFGKDFDPAGIPRIRVQDKSKECTRFCADAWLKYLKANPQERYTSDGDVRTVAVPKFRASSVHRRFAAQVLPY